MMAHTMIVMKQPARIRKRPMLVRVGKARLAYITTKAEIHVYSRYTIRKLKDLVEKYAAKERDTKADGELVLTVPRYMQDLRVGKTYKPT